MACKRRPSGACQGAADGRRICCQDVCRRVWPNVARICVLRGVGRFREIRQRRSHFVGRQRKRRRACEKLDRTVVAGARTQHLQSACAQMRQEVVLLKKVRRPATARLMSVLVGLRSRVVKRGTWTFRMSSGATLTYGTCKGTETEHMCWRIDE